nr:PAS domain-containing protein [Halovenus carboxidivorans]
MEELDDPVVVTDPDGVIVELNPAARREFDWSDRVVGETLKRSLGAGLADLRERRIVEIESETGRVLFEPTVSDLSDRHGHPLGHAAVFQDVTDRRTRRQRLDVLDRLLRHNLRNDLSVIMGYADVIEDRVDDPAALDGVARITDTAEELAELSDRARKSTQLLGTNTDPGETTRIEPLITGLFGDLRAEYDAEFEYRADVAVGVPVAPDQLDLVFRSLIERTLDNNDSEQPAVELRADYDAERTYPLRISIRDNGPGVPQIDREVIETGTETPLEHTSGVDLWTARWLATGFGGDISFEDGEIVLSFPNATVAADVSQ